MRSFQIGQRLGLLGSLGARTFAALDEYHDGRLSANWLVLEKVGRMDLDQYRPTSETEASECILSLARWMAEWHAWGIDHLDLKAGNIRMDDRNGVYRFWLIDLGDIRFRRKLRDSSRIRALVQLNASLSDEAFSLVARRAALDKYLERLPFSGTRTQDLITSIVEDSLNRNHHWKGLGCPGEVVSR